MSDAGTSAERSRHIRLHGAYNFRDIGGYTGADGRTVAWGRIYRADHPGELTDDDVALVHELGVRTVCDLRRAIEQEGAPSRLLGRTGVEVHHLPIGGDAAQRLALTQRMLAGEIRSFTVDEVVAVYMRLLREFPDQVGTAVTLAAQPGHLPLLVHCTAGKDRTGLVIAAILQLLGVDDETIADDYELTDNLHFEGRVRKMLPQLEAVGVKFADVAPFLSAQRDVLLGTIAQVRETWGGFAGYLVAHCGAPADIAERLRAALLEPAAPASGV